MKVRIPMKKTLRILAPMLLSMIPAFAQDELTTWGYPNGRLWAQLKERDKSMFLGGMRSALQYLRFAASGSSSTNCADLIIEFPQGVTINEIMKGIDQFYDDPSNSRSPVVYAYGYIRSKMAGATRGELDEFLERLRKSLQEVPK